MSTYTFCSVLKRTYSDLDDDSGGDPRALSSGVSNVGSAIGLPVQLTHLKADALAFWGQFRAFDWKDDTSVIDCARDTVGLPQSIFVRRCYVELEKIVYDIWSRKRPQTSEPWMVTILGTPGIGKSYFAFYFMRRLAKEGKTVVYHSAVKGRTYLFSSTFCSVVEGDVGTGQKAFSEQLNDPSTYYICDSATPAARPCYMLLITSPDPLIWKKVTKQIGTERYMPVWSLDELRQLWSVTKDFRDITPAELEQRYNVWGGSARYVLERAKTEKPANLDGLINGCDVEILDLLYLSFAKETKDAESSSVLMHVMTEAPYELFVNDFASEYIAQKVATRFREKIASDAKNFAIGAEGVGPLGLLRGMKMEKLVHDMLSQGGTFRIHKLLDVDDRGRAVGDIVESTLTLPA